MKNELKVGVLFLGRRRPGFDMDWGKQMEERVRQQLKQTKLSIFEPSEKAVDDASLRRAMAACEAQKVDALVVLQTTMGDGRLAPTLAQLWPHPIILWATPENQQGDMISSCSLVGVHCGPPACGKWAIPSSWFMATLPPPKRNDAFPRPSIFPPPSAA